MCVVVLLGYFEVAFGGQTFSTSHVVPGILPCVTGKPCSAQPNYPLLDPEASSTQTEPWGHVVNRVLDDSELPLWNPYQGIGAPLAGDPPTAAFDPLLLAFHLNPTPLTQDMTFLIVLMLIGAAAFWAARMLALGPLAATAAGCVYGLSGWFFEYSNNEWFWTFLYMPLMIGCIEWCLRSTRRLPIVLLAFAMAGMVVVGMPELYFMGFFGAGVYACIRLLVGPRLHSQVFSALRLLGGAALGFALASPVILLFAEYLPLSQNTHSGQAGLAPGTDPASYFLNWLMPTISPFLGNDRSFTRNWVGAGAAVLVAAAIASPRAMKRHCGWPLVGMGSVLAFQIYGGTLVHWTKVLPFWSQINWTSFGTPIIACAIALLAGVGVQAVGARSIIRRRFAIALVVLLGVTIFFIVTADRSLALAHDVLLSGGWPLALIVATVVAVVCLRRDGRRGALIVVAVIIVELLLLAPRGFYGNRSDPYPTTRWTSFLVDRTKGNHSRVFSVAAVLYPDRSGVYGLQDPRMVDALYVERSWRYLRSFVSHGLLDRFVGAGPFETAPAIAANPMFDLLGIRYLMYVPNGDGPPSWSNPQYRVVYEDGSVRIFENTHVMPRAFVVHDLHVVPDAKSAMRFLRSGQPVHFPDGSVQVVSIDPRLAAVVESDRESAPRVDNCAGPVDSATIVDYSATSVTIDVDSSCAGLLVLSDMYYPGWTASVNGVDRPVYATDYAFRGVPVPKGHARVVFRYEPKPFRIGIALWIGALAVIVILGILGLFASPWWRARRASRAEAPTAIEGG